MYVGRYVCDNCSAFSAPIAHTHLFSTATLNVLRNCFIIAFCDVSLVLSKFAFQVSSTSTSSFEGALLRLQLLAAEIVVLLHQAHVRWNYHTHWLMLPFPGHVCRIGNLFSTSPFLFSSGDWWPSMEPLFHASWVSYRLPLFSVDHYLFKCFLYSSWISQF